MKTKQKLVHNRLFWVGVLYFAQGFPFGVFYDVLPVHFRSLGVDLREIGLLALLGLAWTVKFLWAPAVDYYRHHRRWMLAADLVMGGCLLYLAQQAGADGWPLWLAIALFVLASATNDIAIDGYTIEMLARRELGVANGLRIALARVGILAAGAILVLSDWLGWRAAYALAAVVLALLGVACLAAPLERRYAVARPPLALGTELAGLVRQPRLLAAVLAVVLALLWLVDHATHWSQRLPAFWLWACGTAGVLLAGSLALSRRVPARAAPAAAPGQLAEGPLFGALAEMLARPAIVPVLAFVLLFKLGDSSMGFMVKPFWVDAGFSATQIGLVSVNLGLVLSVAGGLAGGWLTDRIGIFHALWLLGLAQALSNLGYVWAASIIPLETGGSAAPLPEHQILMYAASALESFTGGLGTAAFLAFLMAIVDKRHAATEYAILSSLFALSRQLAGYASGFGAHYWGYADYFLITFLLAFPAYLLLPWVKRMLRHAEAQREEA